MAAKKKVAARAKSPVTTVPVGRKVGDEVIVRGTVIKEAFYGNVRLHPGKRVVSVKCLIGDNGKPRIPTWLKPIEVDLPTSKESVNDQHDDGEEIFDNLFE